MKKIGNRRLKIVLIAMTAIIITAAAGGGGATMWLHDRLQTTEYCATCHAIAPYYDTWKASDLTAHAHAQAGVACQDCHARTTRDGLRELMVNAFRSGPLPASGRKALARDCLGCHGTHEVLARRTAHLIGPDGSALGRNPHDSHWGPLDCGVCHSIHQPSVDFCSNCHGIPTTRAGWTAAR